MLRAMLFNKYSKNRVTLRIDSNGIFAESISQSPISWNQIDRLEREGMSAIIHLLKEPSEELDTQSISHNDERNFYEDKNTIRITMTLYRHDQDEIWKHLHKNYIRNKLA